MEKLGICFSLLDYKVKSGKEIDNAYYPWIRFSPHPTRPPECLCYSSATPLSPNNLHYSDCQGEGKPGFIRRSLQKSFLKTGFPAIYNKESGIHDL
jgi:hypothetical protein